MTALREHLASKPSGAAPGTKEHTSQLAAVAASYHKRLPDIADAGREDDALAVVRAELASRGCLDADALLAGVAARRKGAAKRVTERGPAAPAPRRTTRPARPLYRCGVPLGMGLEDDDDGRKADRSPCTRGAHG